VDLLALGFADEATPEPYEESFGAYVAARAAHLAATDGDSRRAERERRWSGRLPGGLK
jgi:hypothetical protein